MPSVDQEMQKLAAEEKKLKRELFDLRCQGETERLSDTTRMRNLRRAIARVKTKQNELTREHDGR